MIELRTLGTPELRGADGREGRAVLAQPKRLTLLAFLAVEGAEGFCRRDTLLAAFWPGLDEAHARGALRQALRFLRRTLGDDAVVRRGDDEVGLRGVACDAVAFRRACRAGRFDEALEHYRGPFLPGLHVADAAPELEQWLEQVRDELRQRAVEAASALAARHEAGGSPAAALPWARRAAALAPEDEEVHRRLLVLLDRAGDRAGALHAYQTFADGLARHFAAAPSPQTQALAATLRTRAGAALPTSGPVPGAVPSLAVLPFANLGGDPEHEYLADGITDEVMAALGRVGGLRVASRAASFTFKGRPAPLHELRQLLDVDAVIEGSVQREGSTIRVVARLTDVETGDQLWAERYERALHDVFAVQEHLAHAIVGAVRVTLTGAEAHALAQHPTDDVEAYTLYLRGRFHWNKRPRETGKALGFLEQAVARDPRFALAHAALADAYNTLGSWEAALLPAWEAFPRAQAEAIRALEIAPHLAEAHTSLAYASMHFLWQWEAAEQQFRRAVTLDPHYAHCRHWYAHYLMAVGRTAEALDESRRGLALDPLDLILNVHLAWHHWLARAYDEALEQCGRARELDAHDPWPLFFAGLAHGHQGAFDAAVDAHRQAARADDSPVMVAALGYTYAAAGEAPAARTLLAELNHRAGARGRFAYERAVIHTALGEPDLAFDWLDAACAERAAWMAYLRVDPRLDPLRGDARFGVLLRAVGLLAP